MYARTVLHVGDTGYGLLVASWGLGLFLGTLAVGRIGRRYEPGRLFGAAMGLLGLMLALYAYAANLGIAIVIGVVGGAGNGVLLNLLQTLLQQLTPADMLGRVGGFFMTARDVTAFLSMLLSGLLADRLGVQPIFFVAGLIMIAAALLPLLTAPRRRPVLDWLSPAQSAEPPRS